MDNKLWNLKLNLIFVIPYKYSINSPYFKFNIIN